MLRPLLSLRHGRRRRPLAGAVAALVLAVTAAACDPPPPENPPFWHPGTTVDASLHGPLVRIQWDATTGGDPVGSYQISLGTYNGTVVALVPASVRDCLITGLNANTTYTIVVTARDAQQHWSGPLVGTHGNRSTPITTGSQAGAGSLWCHTDADADGLPDAWETDDGTYATTTDAGTDPMNPDTDNDGISDGVETLGRPGLNLIGMGARPTHKDLLIETDWIAGAPCSTQPTVAKLAPMVSAFIWAPVENPDGIPGINLIVDHGQGGHFTGGTQVPDIEGPVDGNFPSKVAGAPFATTKAAHFAPARKGVFRYSVIHGVVNGSSNAEGGGEGDDTYVSGKCGDSNPLAFSGILMHEIGHNLGMGHGGTTAGLPGPDWHREGFDGPAIPVHKSQINAKPNYVSVMNYPYMAGLDDSCKWIGRTGPQWLDYSSGGRDPIDENAIDESAGACNGIDADFNLNGNVDATPYRKDLNGDEIVSVFHDHDDWGHIEASGLAGFADDPD